MKISKLLSLWILIACFQSMHAQSFDTLKHDEDTICGVIIYSCSSKYGHHLIDYEKMNKDDSLKCSKTSHYPLENSNKVLCVVRNFYGDTLAIGLKNEKPVKDSWSFFKRPYLKTTGTLYGEEIGDWYYYDHDGQLLEIKKY